SPRAIVQGILYNRPPCGADRGSCRLSFDSCPINMLRSLRGNHMKQRRKPKALLWSLSCVGLAAAPAWANVYPLPADGSSVVGTDETMQTVYEDTLPDLAHRFSLGYYEIIRANPGVDVWLPGAGRKLVLPGRRILPAGARRGPGRDPPRAPVVLLPQAPPGRAAGSHHLSGEHRQDGLAHAARRDAGHRQDQTPGLVSAGVDPQGARREWRSAAEGRGAGP